MTANGPSTQSVDSFAELSAFAERAARSPQQLPDFVASLTSASMHAASRQNVRELADVRARLARLVDHLRRLESDRDAFLLGAIQGFLRGLIESLEQTEVTIRVELQSRRRDADVRRLRTRVLEELGRSRRARPKDLTKALKCAPAQISRALRELEASGLVEPVPRGLLGDRRERWYRAVAVETAAAEAAAQRYERKAAEPPASFTTRSLEHQIMARIKCFGPLTITELEKLTAAEGADLERRLKALAAVDLLALREERFELTGSGAQELEDLAEHGLSETVDDIERLVPEDFVGVIVLMGAPGSGKRAAARELANRRRWRHVSIGLYVRECAPADIHRADLDEFARNLIGEIGWHEFIGQLIASTGTRPGEEPIVIDAASPYPDCGCSPYPDGLDALRAIYTDILPVFLQAPDWMRSLTHKQEQEAGFDPASAPLEVGDSAFETPVGWLPVAVQATGRTKPHTKPRTKAGR